MSYQLVNASLLMLVMLCGGAAQAQQTVWRCGPGGTSYSNQPCPEGRAVGAGVGASDSRASNDVQAAREVAARDRALAKELRQERLQREAEQRAQGSGLGGFSAAKPALPVDAKAKAKPKAKTKAKTKRKPPQPAADQTSPKAARASRRAQG